MAKQSTDSIKSKRDLRDYKIKILKDVTLPIEYKVRHGTIRNQGKVNSCVAHAFASICEVAFNRLFSVLWNHGLREDNEFSGSGGSTNNQVGHLYKYGAVPYEMLPGNVDMPEAKEIVDKNKYKLLETASNYKVSAYARLEKVKEIKQAIYNGGLPVEVSLHVKLADDGISGILDYDNNYVAYIPTKEDKCSLHAVVCYGWNEKGLLIQNSWGEEWGNKGTCIVPFSYPIEESWVLSFDKIKSNLEIVKPNLYWLRELIMKLIKLIRKIKKGKE